MRWLPLVLLAACLSVPPPRAGVADGGAGSTDGPGRGAAIDAPPIGPGTEWPPMGPRLEVRPGGVADLDGDGRDDLVLLNASGDHASQGIYVLLARPTGVGKVYDTFARTEDVIPLAASIVRLGGDDRPDLLVMAAERSTPGGAYDRMVLLAYEGTGRGGLTERGRGELPGFVPDTNAWFGRAFVTVGHFRSDGVPELVVGTGGKEPTPGAIAVVSLDAWSPFAIGTPRTLVCPPGAQPDNRWVLEGALPLRAPTGRDDLIVVDQQFIVWYQSSPAGLLAMHHYYNWSRLTAGYQRPLFAPFPGDTTLSVWGGGDHQVGATRVDLGALTLEATLEALQLREQEAMPDLPIGTLAHLAAFDLDADDKGRLDVVTLDAVAPFTLRVYPNPIARRDVTVLATLPLLGDAPLSLTPQAPGPTQPNWVVAGNFSAPRQILLFEAKTGKIGCYRIAGGTLAHCDPE